MKVHAGVRYAMVFFCQGIANARTPGAVHTYLTGLGFRLPADASLRPSGTERQLVELALRGILGLTGARYKPHHFSVVSPMSNS